MGGSVGLSHVEHTHAVTYVEDPARRRQLGRRAQLLAVASVGMAGTFLTRIGRTREA